MTIPLIKELWAPHEQKRSLSLISYNSIILVVNECPDLHTVYMTRSESRDKVRVRARLQAFDSSIPRLALHFWSLLYNPHVKLSTLSHTPHPLQYGFHV